MTQSHCLAFLAGAILTWAAITLATRHDRAVGSRILLLTTPAPVATPPAWMWQRRSYPLDAPGRPSRTTSRK